MHEAVCKMAAERLVHVARARKFGGTVAICFTGNRLPAQILARRQTAILNKEASECVHGEPRQLCRSPSCVQ